MLLVVKKLMKYIGRTKTINDHVASVHVDTNSINLPTFMNLGLPYPRSPCVAISQHYTLWAFENYKLSTGIASISAKMGCGV